MDYGTTNVMLSRVNPFPASDDDAQFARVTDDFCLAQSDWILCPNLHEGSFFFFFFFFFFFPASSSSSSFYLLRLFF